MATKLSHTAGRERPFPFRVGGVDALWEADERLIAGRQVGGEFRHCDRDPLTGQLRSLAELVTSRSLSSTQVQSFNAEALALADAHWLAPLAAHVLLGGGQSDLLDGEVRTLLRRHLAFEASFELLTRRSLLRIVGRLTEDGVPHLLMKGAALAYTHYPQPYLRPRLDSDMLVKHEHWHQLGHLLEAEGYRASASITGRTVSHQAQYVTELAGGLHHAIDVHWKISNPAAFADLFAFDELYAASVLVNDLSPQARTPGGAHTLLLLAIHRMAHHQRDLDLLCLYDLHVVAERLTELEWKEVMVHAERRGLTAIGAEAVGAAQRMYRTTLPPTVGKWVSSHIDEPVPERFQPFVNADRRVADVIASDIRIAPTWRHRVTIVREHVFPPADYMLARAGTRRRWLLPYLYLRRCLCGAPRILRRGVYR